MDGNDKTDSAQEINKNAPNEDKIKCIAEEKIRQNEKMNSEKSNMLKEDDKSRYNEEIGLDIDNMHSGEEKNKINDIIDGTQPEGFYSEINKIKYEEEKSCRTESMKSEIAKIQHEEMEAVKNLANKQENFADMDPEIRYQGSDSSRSPGREDIIDEDSSGSSDGEEDVDSGIAEEPLQVRRPFDCYDLANFFSYW